jgi:hypothetical protein
MPVIPKLGRLSQPGLQSKFKDTLNYIEIPCLKKIEHESMKQKTEDQLRKLMKQVT